MQDINDVILEFGQGDVGSDYMLIPHTLGLAERKFTEVIMLVLNNSIAIFHLDFAPNCC